MPAARWRILNVASGLRPGISDLSALCGALEREMKPDFMAAYRPPVEMQTVDHQSESTVGVYPGLLFAAAVHVRTSKSS